MARLTGPVLIVICERQPPLDLLVPMVGWRSLIEEMPLGPLQPEEALAFLHAQGVRGLDADAAAQMAGGNPLILALAGEMVLREPDPLRRTCLLAYEAAGLMNERLRREGADAGALALLEAASLLPRVDEEILAAMVGVDTASDFRRFAHLSVVVQDRTGYSVAEPFRSLLALNLQLRRPRWCQEMRAKAAAATSQPSNSQDSFAVELSGANAPSHPAGVRPVTPELLAQAKAALEWLRESRNDEPCPLAARLASTRSGLPSQPRVLLAGIIRGLTASRAPRVADAGRLLEVYYLGRAASWEMAGERLNLSRSTAFRRMRFGITLVAERLAPR